MLDAREADRDGILAHVLRARWNYFFLRECPDEGSDRNRLCVRDLARGLRNILKRTCQILDCTQIPCGSTVSRSAKAQEVRRAQPQERYRGRGSDSDPAMSSKAAMASSGTPIAASTYAKRTARDCATALASATRREAPLPQLVWPLRVGRHEGPPWAERDSHPLRTRGVTNVGDADVATRGIVSAPTIESPPMRDGAPPRGRTPRGPGGDSR